MIGMELEVQDDGALASLDELGRRLGPDRLNAIVGRAARKAVRANFMALNAERHRSTIQHRVGYYEGAARSTHFTVDPDGSTVSVEQIGIALHYFGGDVHAGVNASSATGKPTVYLTIPARDEAVGHRAADFGDQLEMLWGKRGPFALALKTDIRPGLKGASKAYNKSLGQQAGMIMFWLVPATRHDPDTTVLPDEDEFSDVISTDLEPYLTRLTEREQMGSGELEGGET